MSEEKQEETIDYAAKYKELEELNGSYKKSMEDTKKWGHAKSKALNYTLKEINSLVEQGVIDKQFKDNLLTNLEKNQFGSVKDEELAQHKESYKKVDDQFSEESLVDSFYSFIEENKSKTEVPLDIIRDYFDDLDYQDKEDFVSDVLKNIENEKIESFFDKIIKKQSKINSIKKEKEELSKKLKELSDIIPNYQPKKDVDIGGRGFQRDFKKTITKNTKTFEEMFPKFK